MLIYATVDDLTDWTETTAPDNATQLLRTASLLVRKATLTARYATDTTGLPTETLVAQAFRDATCAHAAAMDAANINPLAGGAVTTAATATSKKVGSAQVEYAGSAAAAAARAELAECLAPEAQAILQHAGLVPSAVAG